MPPLPDSGSEAWVLTSMALVQLMTPGVSFFYAGLSRQRSSLSTSMMCLGCMSLITLLWSLVGFSIAFGESIPSGVLGGLQYSTLDQVTADTNVQWARAPAITTRTFSMFHLMLAMLTSAIICGSLVDKIKYHYFLLFSGAWHLLVYCPLAHHVFFPGGWLAQYGVLDFAGGLVVHTASGTSALVFSFWLSTMSNFNLNSMPDWQSESRTGNFPFVLFGTFLLWYGWLGLSGGSALSSASYSAGLAATNSQLGGAAGLMAWHLMQVLRRRGWRWGTGHPTAMGACTGVVTGLVAITPGAGYVSPMWSVATAVAAVALAYPTLALLRRVRVLRRVDDSLDCFAIHGVAGMVGTLLTGLLADSRQSGLAGASGAAFGSPMQLARQAVGILAVLAISTIGTSAIFWALWLLAWARRDRLDEFYLLGAELDSYQHGEAAYSTDSGGLQGTMMEGASSGRRGGEGSHSGSRGQRAGGGAAAGCSGGKGRGIAAQSRRAQWQGGSEAGAGSSHKPSLPELMPVGLRDSGEERAPAPALKLDVVVEDINEEITLGGQQTEAPRAKHEEAT